MTNRLGTWVVAPLFTVGLALGLASPTAQAQAPRDKAHQANQPRDEGEESDESDDSLPAPIAPEAPIDFPYTPPPDPSATGYDAAAYGTSQTTEVSYAREDEGAVTYDGTVDDVIADSYDDGYNPTAYREFEEALAAYGSWVEDPRYGRVWVPAGSIVGAEFTPYYTNGQWMLSEYGWTWVSAWSWGWAPFHYGRWVVSPGWGWTWVPGTMWGPAWVSWRLGGGYVGWAPLPPRGVVLAANLGPTSPWRFTTVGGLGASRLSCLPPQRISELWRGTAVVANDRLLSRGSWTVHINAGPTRAARLAPVPLASVAPQALPRLRVVPRPGTSLGTRPWTRPFVDAPAAATSRPAARPFPSHGAPAGGRPPAVHPGLRSGAAPVFAPTPASSFRTSPIRPASPPIRTFAAPSTPFPASNGMRGMSPHVAPPAEHAAPPPAAPAQVVSARPEPPAFHSREPGLRTTSRPTFPGAGVSAQAAPSAFPVASQPFGGPAQIHTPRFDNGPRFDSAPRFNSTPRFDSTPPPATFQRPQPMQATTAPRPSPVPMGAPAPMPRTAHPGPFNQQRTFAPATQPMAPPATHLGNPGAARFGGAHRR